MEFLLALCDWVVERRCARRRWEGFVSSRFKGSVARLWCEILLFSLAAMCVAVADSLYFDFLLKMSLF